MSTRSVRDRTVHSVRRYEHSSGESQAPPAATDRSPSEHPWSVAPKVLSDLPTENMPERSSRSPVEAGPHVFRPLPCDYFRGNASPESRSGPSQWPDRSARQPGWYQLGAQQRREQLEQEHSRGLRGQASMRAMRPGEQRSSNWRDLEKVEADLFVPVCRGLQEDDGSDAERSVGRCDLHTAKASVDELSPGAFHHPLEPQRFG
jgi:hypothetical protein